MEQQQQQKSTKLVPKRESILNQEIRDQIHELLNHEYKLSRPSRILLNMDRGELENNRSVRIVDQNVPRVRISSEGPPQSYVREIRRAGPSRIGALASRLLVDSSTQTPASQSAGSSNGLNNAAMSETETLSIVKLSETERLANLKQMLESDYYYGYRPRSPFDPCLEYQLYFRKGVDQNRASKMRSISAPRLPTRSETILMHTRSSQTTVDPTPTQQPVPQPAPRSSYQPQSPPNSVHFANVDSVWTPSTEASTPTNVDLAAKTKTFSTVQPVTVPHTGASTTTVDEYFFLRQSRRSQPNSDLSYRQYSEYSVDPRSKSIEKVNSYLDISDQPVSPQHQHQHNTYLPPAQQKVIDIKDLKRSRPRTKPAAKLSQSTIEMTSVVDNKTKVQGVTVKDSSPDKFTIHIVNPDGYENIMSQQNAPRGASGQLRHSVQTMVHSSRSNSPKIAHSLAAEKYDMPPPPSARPRQKPYVLGCAEIEQMNCAAQPQPQQQQQQPQTQYYQTQPQQQQTEYQYVQQDEQYYYDQGYEPQYVYVTADPNAANDPQQQYVYYEYDPQQQTQYDQQQPLYQYEVVEQPVVVQPQPRQQRPQQRQPTIEKLIPQPQQTPTNFASNYEKYHYWLDKQRRKSPSRSSGNRSVSPLSVRAAAPSETQIVEELKQLRRKKEMEYEAAANAQLRSPPNQERIRRVIDESRRMEAHMKREQQQKKPQQQGKTQTLPPQSKYQSYSSSNPNIIDVDFSAYEEENEQPSSYVYVEENRLQKQHQRTTSPKNRQILTDSSNDWPNRQASYGRAIDQTRSKSNNNVADRYRNPYYTGAYLSEEKKARLEKFSTEKTQVNIPSASASAPVPKDRQSQQPVDIDFSTYDEPPSMSLQQGSRAKVTEEVKELEVFTRTTTTTTTLKSPELIGLDLDRYEKEATKEKRVIEETTSGDEAAEEDEVDEDIEEDDAIGRKLVENLRQKYQQQQEAWKRQQQQQQENESYYVQPIVRQPTPTMNKYLSVSNEDLRVLKERRRDENNKSKIRVIARHPIKRSHDSLVGLRPRLTRSFERVNIEERSSDEDSSLSADYGEVISVTGIGSNPMRRVEIEREKRRLQDEFFKRIAAMEKPIGDYSPRLGGSSKLDDLIEAKLRREYTKAVRRINKRKWRVPEILSQLDRVRGKDRKKLEDELTLLMRKAKLDNELVKKFGPIYSSTPNPTPPPSQASAGSIAKINASSSETLDGTAKHAPIPRYTKNKPSPTTTMKIDPTKYKKPGETNVNKTFESGYSSLDEYVSGGDLRAVGSRKQTDVAALVAQAEKSRCARPNDFTSKVTDLAIEAPRVEALPQVQLAVAPDDAEYNDREERNRFNRRVPRQPRAAQNDYVAQPPIASRRQVPVYQAAPPSGMNNDSIYSERYQNLSDMSSSLPSPSLRRVPLQGDQSPAYRVAPPGINDPPASGNNSGRSNVRTTPLSPTGSSGGATGSASASSPSSPRSPTSSYRNATGPTNTNQGNSGIYVNVDQLQGGGDQQAPSNTPPLPRSGSSSPSSRGGRKRSDSSSSGSRRNLPQPPSGSQDDENEEMNYIEEDELATLDPNKYDLVQNEETGESILVDQATNEQYTVLPRNWRSSPDSYYIADADIDFTIAKVYSDGRNKRRYVYDPRTTRRFFLVPLKSVRRLTPDTRKTDIKADAPNVFQVVHESAADDEEIEVHYVEESELEGLDLTSFSVYRDDENGEVLIVDAGYPNRFWVILRDDWRTAEELPYLSEEDVAQVSMDVYTDGTTRRKFVIDEKSGERYYIVPKFRENIRNYVTTSNVPLKVPAGKHIAFDDKDKSKRAQSHDDTIVKRLGTEVIHKLDKEPSTLRLRQIAMNSPERFKGKTLSPPKRVVIKQPGKPGHLITKPNEPATTTPTAAKRTTFAPTTPTAKSASASPSPRAATVDTAGAGAGVKKPSVVKAANDPALIRARQETARRNFYAQKLPHVGDLWLHQELIDKINTKKKFDCLKEAYLAKKNLEYEDDPSRYLDENGRVRSFRDLTDLNDPTLNDDKDGLDMDKLANVQMYGYEKYNKNKRKIFGEKEENMGKTKNTTKMPNNKSFGGFQNNYPFVRGILTEDFVEDREYAPVQLNPYFRALMPFTKLNLRQQFLLTPGYLRHEWSDIVHKPGEGLTPRIILIDDDERIITKNRDCNVYVQYYYEHDGVLGANPAYQLMLPDRGPTKPARPVTISPAKLSKKMEILNSAAGVKKPQMALREAPVFVYHPNGSAYYENIAQYLANKKPQLSPASARKLLQFSDLDEFEDYLSSKCTREEAKRIADASGELLINVDAIKGDLLKALSGDATYYDVGGCEYDPLRQVGKDESISEETREFEVNGKIIKSTFIGMGNDGKVKRVKSNELPQNINNIVAEAVNAENTRKSVTAK